MEVCETKKNCAYRLSQAFPWDRAKDLVLLRSSPCGSYNKELDHGVNYFVLMLEQLGANTHYSCEGHPNGFYVLFAAPLKLALKICACGFFKVELEGKNRWSIRTRQFQNEAERTQFLRMAATQWEEKLGPLQALVGK